MSKSIVYKIETGILLSPTDREYDLYKGYGTSGLYDEDQWYERDKEQAIHDAKDFVNTSGYENAYAIVSLSNLNIDDTVDISEKMVEHETYNAEDIVFSIKREKQKIETGFIKQIK